MANVGMGNVSMGIDQEPSQILNLHYSAYWYANSLTYFTLFDFTVRFVIR